MPPPPTQEGASQSPNLATFEVKVAADTNRNLGLRPDPREAAAEAPPPRDPREAAAEAPPPRVLAAAPRARSRTAPLVTLRRCDRERIYPDLTTSLRPLLT